MISQFFRHPFKTLRAASRFENPSVVVQFLTNNYTKGTPLCIRPKGKPALHVARSGDLWLLDALEQDGFTVHPDRNWSHGLIDINGLLLRQCSSDTFTYKEIFIDQIYSEFTQQIGKDSIVVDIGAHIGLFSFYCSPRCRAIHAYEADESNHLLSLRSQKQRDAGNVHFHHRAVWSESGKSLFIGSEDKQRTGEGVTTTQPRQGAAPVRTISLPHIFGATGISRCHLLKMDIEGGEYDALLESDPAWLRATDLILLEYHPDPAGLRNPADIKSFLADNGFSVVRRPISQEVGLFFGTNQQQP